MKKMKKLLSLCCIVCLLLPLLCGCNALDDARKMQAFYDEEENILWNGAVYKKLPQGEYFSPDIDYGYSKTIYVTKPDVPVLLQEMFCEASLNADKDGVILEKDYSYASGYYDTVYYCREDRYEDVSARLQAPFKADMVCYTYHVYDMESGEFVEKIYRLTNDQWGVLRKILENGEPMEVSAGWELSFDEIVSLEECSEDMLFRRSFLDLMNCGGTYYLEFDDGRTTKIYQVPFEATAYMEKIMAAQRRDSIVIAEEWIA